MIAIYARQSVEKKDSLSIDGQIELCKKECNGEIKEYIDSGFSGKNTDRPAFKNLMRDVENGIISKVVVYRLDRISRSITDFGSIWETFNAHKVEFISINEKFDTTTPMGRAMIYIIMVFAQLERETIAERVKDNYYQRAKAGAYLGGPPTYGFQLTDTIINGKKSSMLVPNENIEIAKEIFERYANTTSSLGDIGKWLKSRGISCTNRSTWDNVSLSRMLHCPTYVKADPSIYLFYKSKGAIMYNDIEEYNGINGLTLFGKREKGENKYSDFYKYMVVISKHQGVIEPDIFLKCQRKLEQNKQIKKTGSGKYTWMSGLMKCDKCGYALRVTKSRNHLYTSCSGKTNFHICDEKNIPLEIVEQEVNKVVQQEIDRLNNTELRINPIKQVDNSNKIRIIDEKISNLIESLSDMGATTAQYVNQKILELDKEKTKLLEESFPVDTDIGNFKDVVFEELDMENKKLIARKLINKIYVSNDGIRVDTRF